ncbi:MAG TPA: hypothetical protein VFQ54_08000, partial [Thermomicrobiales bacterium]|nr:hypothetical protein [Thermomicrobiales bacterium]
MPNRRHIVLSLTVLCSLIFSSLITILASTTAAAQSNATPVAATPFITADGIDSHVLAQSDPAPITIPNLHLVLERLEIPASVALPERTTTGPEILYVENGSVSIEDSVGFATSTAAGEELTFNPGASYALTNDGFLAATVLRLSFGGTTAAATSPVPSAATPVTAARITTLIDQPVTDLPTGDATLFVADATFAAGAES